MISKEETRRNIAKSVGRILKAKGLSQSGLAEASGVDQPRISLMMRQKILMNPCDLANIAAVLGVGVSDLIFDRFGQFERDSETESVVMTESNVEKAAPEYFPVVPVWIRTVTGELEMQLSAGVPRVGDRLSVRGVRSKVVDVEWSLDPTTDGKVAFRPLLTLLELE